MTAGSFGSEAAAPREPGAAPDEPPTILSAPVGPVQPVQTVQPAPIAAPGSKAPRKRPRRRGRFWHALRVVLLVVALPAIALGIGLGIAYLVHAIRGNPTPQPAALPNASSSPIPSTTPPTPSASASPQVVAPADWVTEVAPPAGLTYRHPPGWVRRTQSPEVLRFEPASPGSQTPGIEGVGAGFEAATDPAEALRNFAARAYGSEPGFVAGAVEAVKGQHPGEQQELVTYRRSSVGVRVVLRSFRAQGHTVLVLGRSPSSQPTVASRLESQVEASLKFGG